MTYSLQQTLGKVQKSDWEIWLQKLSREQATTETPPESPFLKTMDNQAALSLCLHKVGKLPQSHPHVYQSVLWTPQPGNWTLRYAGCYTWQLYRGSSVVLPTLSALETCALRPLLEGHEHAQHQLTCPSSISRGRPSLSCSELLVLRMERLWDLRFCLAWRAAEQLPLSVGITSPRWSPSHSCNKLDKNRKNKHFISDHGKLKWRKNSTQDNDYFPFLTSLLWLAFTV